MRAYMCALPVPQIRFSLTTNRSCLSSKSSLRITIVITIGITIAVVITLPVVMTITIKNYGIVLIKLY